MEEKSSTAIVLSGGGGDVSSNTKQGTKRPKRHVNVPSKREFPTPEEWPETYEQVFSRIYNLTVGLTVERRIEWTTQRIRMYSWSSEVCKRVNPHLLNVYTDKLAQLTTTR